MSKPKAKRNETALSTDKQNGAESGVVAKAASASHNVSGTNDKELVAESATSATSLKVLSIQCGC